MGGVGGLGGGRVAGGVLHAVVLVGRGNAGGAGQPAHHTHPGLLVALGQGVDKLVGAHIHGCGAVAVVVVGGGVAAIPVEVEVGVCLFRKNIKCVFI